MVFTHLSLNCVDASPATLIEDIELLTKEEVIQLRILVS